MDLEQEQNIISPSDATKMATKNKELLSTAMKRTSEWIFSQEIPSDVTVNAGGTSFSLHKFPLVSKCGYIRKKLSESKDSDPSLIEIPEIPGGSEAFEFAAKFCYGINFEITSENIATLRCVAEYLEMTEDCSFGNLISRTESFINEVALKTLSGAVSVLHSCETLLPIAEKVRLVSRCIDTISIVACKDSQFCGLVRSGGGLAEPVRSDWWAEDLAVLRIDMFQRVLIAMMARGFKQYALAPILMLYAQKSLRGLEIFGKGRNKIDPIQEHEKRVVLETIVSLLPREKNAMSVSFLSMLLRASIYLETTISCRLDLEKRMSFQLGQAALDDLLIPSYSFTGNTLFDVETVHRIMTNFFECNSDQENFIPSSSEMERVTRLIENYLSKIASDQNLPVSKFIGLAELIPEQSRTTEDGMYRAIDIFLKAHPSLTDMVRKKICGVMDCQKLSREACAHAAQNDRLPVQTVVQVLYYEQQRLRDAMDDSTLTKSSIDIHPVPNQVSSLQRENQDLKLELAKMKMMLKEVANPSDKPPEDGTKSPSVKGSVGKPPLPKKSFISSASRKISSIWADGFMSLSLKGRNKPSRQRRHSIS